MAVVDRASLTVRDDGTPLMYGELAGWFHLLTPPSEYVHEADEVRRLLGEFVVPPLATVLELGSGGGNLASHLSGEWRMTLTDPAAPMLELSRSINPTAEHLEGDMRSLRLDRFFDAVIIHDAVGYMTTVDDLRAALETAFVHVRPGGAAIFMPDWVVDGYRPTTEVGGSDENGRGVRFLEWDREIEPDGHTVLTDYIITTREPNGRVAVYHDVHRLGIFPRAAWLEAMASVGFEPHNREGDEGIDIFIGVRPAD